VYVRRGPLRRAGAVRAVLPGDPGAVSVPDVGGALSALTQARLRL